MKSRFIKILILFLTSFLVSCDPIHNIDFVNKSNSEAKVKINLISKNENYDLKQNAIGDSIVFNLKKDSIANIYFGIGSWDKKEINELTKSIKSIEIETKDVTTIYKSQNSMNEILINNIEGIFMKTVIKIEIK
jgi:hypothetical protein